MTYLLASAFSLFLLGCQPFPTIVTAAGANKNHNSIKFNPPSPLVPVSYTRQSAERDEEYLIDAAVPPTGNYHRRTTSQSAMRPIRIKFYVEPLLKDIQNADVLTKTKGNAIIHKVLPQVEALWSQSLSVVPSPTLVVPPDVCFELYDYPAEWSNDKQGLTDTDLLVFVSAMDFIGSTEICSRNSATTLAVSSPCAIDPVTDRPVVGFANVCLNTLETEMNGLIHEKSIAAMVDVMSHELAHVLGFNSDLYKYFRNSVTGQPLTPRNRRSEFHITSNVPCMAGQESRDMALACENTIKFGLDTVQYGLNEFQRGYYEVVLPTVAQVARNHFNCQGLQGARLENQPTSSDCIGSHFDERTWFTEFMSAFYDKGTAYFSPLTLAFLEDTGWYKSNFRHAHNTPFGLGAGCDFVEDKCIVDEKVPNYGRGYFCSDVESNAWSCGPSHRFRAKCDLSNYSYPRETYFEPSHIGPTFIHADYCPLILSDAQDCDDASGDATFPFEVFGSDSRCMELGTGGAKSAVCLKALCNEQTRSYNFEVENRIFSCTKDFEIIRFIGNSGETYQIQCPRLTQVCPNMFCPSMCSGKGICDWSLPTPACKCFDESDTTPGCYDSAVNEQATCPTSSSPSFQDSNILLIIAVAPVVVFFGFLLV